MNNPKPAAGIYEQLVTEELRQRLDQLRQNGWNVIEEPIGADLAPHTVARHVGSIVEQALKGLTSVEQLVAANLILNHLTDRAPKPQERLLFDDQQAPRRLLALSEPADEAGRYQTRPSTPLSEAALLTNDRQDPSLGPELEAEMASADRIDLLCAFVQSQGLRVLINTLREAHDRGVPIRVITTTYIGATQADAVDRFVRELGAQVKISYETYSTRLHAKAWMFHRNSGYNTAYVGSSNLSQAALLEGLEWNVRVSSVATPAVMNKFIDTFNTYWEDAAFESYDPDVDRERLDDALGRSRRAQQPGGGPVPSSLRNQEVEPYPHQRDMLDRLTVEREVHEFHRNLLVAATGTGKTVMAALDYKRLREQQEGKPLRLLFIAHREEILEQALFKYREVLRDPKFGELYVGGKKPEYNDHVFASIQSFGAQTLEKYAADHFDVIVIDEFHHSAADSYQRLIDHFEPNLEFLGLTATPERSDGIHVHDIYFDGRIAAEMRLWEALEYELLSPFHYFGIADDTDMTAVEWKRGSGYDQRQLGELLTGDDSRAQLIVDSLVDKVPNYTEMRALGFCVNVQHAQYMAEYFTARGIKSAALDGASTTQARRDALEKFKAGRLQALFSVDLFNEGLDIPDVDTLLLLRPTQSPTIFLQQFGRGLRRSPTKPVLTVLDFIGQHRREYHFTPRYKALTGHGGRRLLAHVKADFPKLPAGCRIILDRKSKERVVDNIRAQVDVNVKQLAVEVREAGERQLKGFLKVSGRELKELYRSNDSSWTSLLRRADLLPKSGSKSEDALLKRVFTFLHVDDERRVNAYTRLLQDGAPNYDDLGNRDQAFARMLFFSLWPDGGGFSSYAEGLATLGPHREFRNELRQVLAYNLDHTETLPVQDPTLPETLSVHCAYSREEYFAALGLGSIDGPYPSTFQEGARWCASLKADALFVTLEKKEKDFSPETRYSDYALGPHHFHWDSQNSTSPTSEVGKRYQTHKERGTQVLLFVRRYKTNDIGKAHASTLLGPAEYVRHEGSKPMSIVWKLKHELPADVLTYSSITH
ncbi:DUF3427 domain-containing protein [Streptomyces winkii]|uniref:DUF3427 domain-containing protein n=1 Tax=Streptomyces winkii TaxID=3051178 RepID=UPI0028D5C6C6|nr:DUF3427 domain-containing protein [Streptomyces sp. DSM 40971]